jgi:hypothetical protein
LYWRFLPLPAGLPMLLGMHANDSEKATLFTHYQHFVPGPADT